MHTKISYVKHLNVISEIKREVSTCEQKLGSIALNGSSKLSEKSLINTLTFFLNVLWNHFLFFNKLSTFRTVIT